MKLKAIGFVMLLLGLAIVIFWRLNLAYQWEVSMPSKLIILGHLLVYAGLLLPAFERWSLKKAAWGSLVLGFACFVAGVQGRDGGFALLFGSLALVTSIALFYRLGVEHT